MGVDILFSQASPSSRFYVLHDWEHTYSQDKSTAPLPAVEVSDIMLKTMGILKVWSMEKDNVTHSLLGLIMVDQPQTQIHRRIATTPD